LPNCRWLWPLCFRPWQAQRSVKPSPRWSARFDKDDPEIQRLRTLNWKAVDFDAQDLETRTVALLAMQEVLSMTGGKASARLELLIDYFDQNKLGEAYVDKQQAANLPPLISYDEARKVAVAFVKSDVGKDKFGDDLAGSDDATLKAYMQMLWQLLAENVRGVH